MRRPRENGRVRTNQGRDRWRALVSCHSIIPPMTMTFRSSLTHQRGGAESRKRGAFSVNRGPPLSRIARTLSTWQTYRKQAGLHGRKLSSLPPQSRVGGKVNVIGHKTPDRNPSDCHWAQQYPKGLQRMEGQRAPVLMEGDRIGRRPRSDPIRLGRGICDSRAQRCWGDIGISTAGSDGFQGAAAPKKPGAAEDRGICRRALQLHGSRGFSDRGKSQVDSCQWRPRFRETKSPGYSPLTMGQLQTSRGRPARSVRIVYGRKT